LKRWRHEEAKEMRKANETLKLATLEGVARFNHHRLIEPIGYIPPAGAEANDHRPLAGQAVTVEA